jgi:hypothetical protein
MSRIADMRAVLEHPTLAVDLDMTLTAEPWREHDIIGPPAPHSRIVLERFRRAGWQIVIYTCRPHIHAVRAWADEHYPGLIDGINCNPFDVAHGGMVTPKPFAHIYIDEKAWPLRGDPVDWYAVEKDMEDRGIFGAK